MEARLQPFSFSPMSGPMPSRRDGEATRQRLLRSALELYTTVGFRATTTPAIAARAGVAEGTIYRHFSGKEHLLNEVYRDAQRWGTTAVREPETELSLRAPERLQQIARRLLEEASRDPAMVRMLLRARDEQHLDERSRETSREFREALRQVVAGGKADALVRQGPAELWTEVWLALVTFAAERVGTKEWAPDGSQVTLTLQAAWDAIKA
jgi:TetR/AcrR family transcriptional regulator, repressor of fatR-cypB operon